MGRLEVYESTVVISYGAGDRDARALVMTLERQIGPGGQCDPLLGGSSWGWLFYVMPGKTGMAGWKITTFFDRIYIFKRWVFHCHVSFSGVYYAPEIWKIHTKNGHI